MVNREIVTLSFAHSDALLAASAKAKDLRRSLCTLTRAKLTLGRTGHIIRDYEDKQHGMVTMPDNVLPSFALLAA